MCGNLLLCSSKFVWQLLIIHIHIWVAACIIRIHISVEASYYAISNLGGILLCISIIVWHLCIMNTPIWGADFSYAHLYLGGWFLFAHSHPQMWSHNVLLWLVLAPHKVDTMKFIGIRKFYIVLHTVFYSLWQINKMLHNQ